MPEGPSIVILKEQTARFAGQRVREVSGNSKQPLQRMQGLRLRDVCSWGKHYLLRFDDPFEYDGRQHQVALVRSRWEGHEIGDGTSTSVNLLLVRDQGLLDKPDAGIEDFEHIAWAQITTL